MKNKAVKLALTGLLCLFTTQLAKGQAPQITSVKFNSDVVQPYEKWEATLTLSRQVLKYLNNSNTFDNTQIDTGKYLFPHDDSDVIVKALIVRPGGGTSSLYIVRGFYDMQYYFDESSCTEVINYQNNSSKPQKYNLEVMLPAERKDAVDNWKIRFTPDTMEGTYYVTFAVSDKYSIVSGARTWAYYDTSFLVSGEPLNDGFIRMLEGRERYLYRERTHNMEYLVGAFGPNVSVQTEYSCAMQKDIEEYKANNINFFRVWIDGMVPWDWNRNFYLVGYDKYEGSGAIYSRIYNEMNCKRLDTLLDLFQQNDIMFQICFFAPNLGDDDVDVATSRSPYYKNSVAYGTPWLHPLSGVLDEPFDWYRGANTMQKNQIRYAVSRWGHHTNLVSWEIGNEIVPTDSVVHVNEATGTAYYQHPRWRYGFRNALFNDDTVRRWFMELKNYTKDVDPYKHLVTTSIRGDIEGRLSDSSLNKWIFQHLGGFSGSFDVWDITGNDAIIRNKMDWNVTHKYFTNPTCPNADSSSRFKRQEEGIWELTRLNIINNDQWSQLDRMPFMLQEWGWGDDHCKDYEDTLPDSYKDLRFGYDPHLFVSHNVLWVNLFSQACGLPYQFDAFYPMWDMRVWKAPGGFYHGLTDIPDDAIPLFHDEGPYRHSSLTWPDKDIIMGWCQNTQFTFANLYWNHEEYLKTISNALKPEVDPYGRTIDFIINNDVSDPTRAYRVEYYHTITGDLIKKDTVFMPYGPPPQILSIPYPDFMKDAEYGDFAFKAYEICSPLLRFSVNGERSPFTNEYDTLRIDDTLTISAFSGGFNDEDSLIITERDESGALLYADYVKEVWEKDMENYHTVEYRTHELPLLCEGSYTQDTISQTRYFLIQFFTSDCDGNPVIQSRKYLLLPEDVEAELSISDTAGATLQDPMLTGFGEPIWLNPDGTSGSDYLQYFVEEIDDQGAFIARVNTCANENAGMSPIKLQTYLGYNNVCSPWLDLRGSAANPRWYRIILIANKYRSCENESNATDTVWLCINDCDASGSIDFVGVEGSAPYYETKWYAPDTLWGNVNVKNTTRIIFNIDWVLNGSIVAGPSSGYSLGKYDGRARINISDWIEYMIDNTIATSHPERVTDSMLFRISYTLSNSVDSGCDDGDTVFEYINYLHCKHIPYYRIHANNSIYTTDSITVAPGTKVFIDAELTKGGPFYTVKAEYRTTGAYTGQKQSLPVYKYYPEGYDLSYLYEMDPIGNDTTTYKITCTSVGQSLDDPCTDTIRIYKYIVVPPHSPVTITLKDSLPDSDFIVFCDTTTWLPIGFSNLDGVRSVKISLRQQYYFISTNEWDDLYLYDNVSHRPYLVEWMDSMAPPKWNLMELNTFSLYRRNFVLEKDLRWKVTVQIQRPTAIQEEDFHFYFSSTCSSPAPLEPYQLIRDTDDSSHLPIAEVIANECIVYPNPGSLSVFLNCSDTIAKFTILDAHGKEVYCGRNYAGGSKTLKFDTENLPEGLYFIKLSTLKGKKYSTKWIKID